MSDEDAIRKCDEIIAKYRKKALFVIAAWTKATCLTCVIVLLLNR